MKSLHSFVAFALALAAPVAGFSPASPTPSNGLLRTPQSAASPAAYSPLFQKQSRGLHVIRSGSKDSDLNSNNNIQNSKRQKLKNIWTQVARRLDTLEAAGIPNAKKAGLFGVVKKVHDPKTYLLLLSVAGFKYDWCFRSIYFWFIFGFCIKWYRARYVFKIPVWDRQPNWNNVITSKEQEKDLKAFTCKNCGSTIFIAKTREFFFEGGTGIGGLGCFSCGAKGKDNFVMDRDRIVEDLSDEDDYFDYETPLDFVSRAEKRKLLKEAKGNEELANKLLVDRTNAAAGITDETPTEETTTEEVVDAEVETPSEEPEEPENEEVASIEEEEPETESTADEEPEVSDKVEPVAQEPVKEAPPKKAPAPKKPAPKKAPEPSDASGDDFDILGLD